MRRVIPRFSSPKKAALFWGGTAAASLILLGLLYAGLFGPAKSGAPITQFVVEQNESVEQVGRELEAAGIVRSRWAFYIAYRATYNPSGGIRSGGYELSSGMDTLAIAKALVAPPYYALVTIPVGLRKEEIAELLAKKLSWNAAQQKDFLEGATSTSKSFVEGVYFPDTYLIPSDQEPRQVAERLRGRFKEVMVPYIAQASERGIPWQEALIVASLIQREAGSASDMPIISSVIWQRLDKGMPLAIDATLQYMVGNQGNGWWAPPRSAKTYPDDPFNTYKRTGLPPHPIANPGLAAIEAAISPASTKCLFYIHDNDGAIHCSATYAGQLHNVNKYLK